MFSLGLFKSLTSFGSGQVFEFKIKQALKFMKTFLTGNQIDAYTRTPPGGSLRQVSNKRNKCLQPVFQLKGSRGDFGRFVINDGVVVAGDT